MPSHLLLRAVPPPSPAVYAVANIALVKADKARKVEDLLIMNAQRGAALRCLFVTVVTAAQA